MKARVLLARYSIKGWAVALTLLCCLALCPWGAQAQSDTTLETNPDSCTSIMVGRLASTDGSVMTAHTCDGGYRNWVNIVPSATYESGAMNKIYRGLMFNESIDDPTGITEVGEVPQASETYAFVNTAYPAMNEHQLGIGETTIGGRREMRSELGFLQIEELERLALERTTTARDAIKLIGELVKEYGYKDSGECLTFIDPKEVWHFEIMGPSKGKLGGVWAAVRIPDDHVGVSANIPRIAELDLDNPDYFMASENVHSLAEELGFWDPDNGETFKFWKAYSGRTPFSIREWWVLSHMAPSLNLSIDADELPFSVKPDKKVSVRDVMAMYRECYAGSEYDTVKNLRGDNGRLSQMINPWMPRGMSQLLNQLKPDSVSSKRFIAINGCAYYTVIQARDWLPDPIGGITWLGFDNPAHGPHIPVFSGVTELPDDFDIGNQKRFRTDSAAWAVRRASRLAQQQWGRNAKAIDDIIQKFEDQAFDELPAVEKAALELMKDDPEKAKQFLTTYTNNFCRTVIDGYWKLGDELWKVNR